MGPETFLGVLPLNIDAEDQEEVNVWLFPILKQYTIGARLSFFVGPILNMVELLRQKSQKVSNVYRHNSFLSFFLACNSSINRNYI